MFGLLQKAKVNLLTEPDGLIVVTWKGGAAFALSGALTGVAAIHALRPDSLVLSMAVIVGAALGALAWIFHSALMLAVAFALRKSFPSARDGLVVMSMLMGAIVPFLFVLIPVCSALSTPIAGPSCLALAIERSWPWPILPGGIAGLVSSCWIRAIYTDRPGARYGHFCPQCDIELQPSAQKCSKCPAVFTTMNGWKIERRRIG